MKLDLHYEIDIPEKVEVKFDKKQIVVKGPKGESKKLLINPHINMEVKNNKVIMDCKKATKNEKKIMHTFRAHIRNLLKGVVEGHTYKLKICHSHFPMNVSVLGNKLVVKNFLGEAKPRELKIKDGAKVKVNGDIIEVESHNKETAGQVAGDIELMVRITNRDKRRFQDGIYITSKDGKDL